MKIIITSATGLEVQPLKEMVAAHASLPAFHTAVQFHSSGVGILQSCFSIQKMMWEQRPELVIQVGIAGTFDRSCALGDVVLVKKEYAGSCGVEEHHQWNDLFDLNLLEKNTFPFNDTALNNPWTTRFNTIRLPEVNAITIDEITTSRQRADSLSNKYNCFLETMEGAALHYCGLQYQIPFLQVRGISNFVCERDKRHWKIKEAVEAACASTFELLQKLE